MRLKFTVNLMVIAFLMISCHHEKDEVQPQLTTAPPRNSTESHGHTVVIQEVLQATSYTYLNVKEGDQTFWMAIRKADLQVGETLSFADGAEMRNFPSRDLQRTFESILFVGAIRRQADPSSGTPPVVAPQPQRPVLEKKEISIEPTAGGITIGELFSQRDAYADKTVLIKGKVTKINRGIMGKNWIHLQDGTGDSESFDLTVTTQADAEVGDVIVFEGKITLNKDFGAGYNYDIIMEEAQQKN
ncbi:OB-fold nucleic acid binding domain-containing protein [Planctomycetota bacterium]